MVGVIWTDHLFSLDGTSVMSCRKENRIICDRRDPLKRFAIRFAKMIFIRASFPSIFTLFIDFFIRTNLVWVVREDITFKNDKYTFSWR